MKRTMLIAGSAILLGLFAACSDTKRYPIQSDAIRGSGNLISEIWRVIPFDELIMSAAGNINITSGSANAYSITVDDNIMPHIEHELSNGSLTFRIAEDVDAVDYDLTIDMVVSGLESVIMAGAGNITGQNQLQTDELNLTLAGVGNIEMDIDCDLLRTVMAGQGNFELSGSATRHTCVLAGVGNVSAFELATNTSVVTIAGVGNVEVAASDRLDAIIAGIGDIQYHGDPNLTVSISGVGRVIDAD